MNKLYNVHTIWLAMLVLTVLTYAMGALGLGGAKVMLLLMVVAAIKSTFIIRDFMGLRGVSLLWRVIMYGWLIFVVTGISIAYLISLS